MDKFLLTPFLSAPIVTRMDKYSNNLDQLFSALSDATRRGIVQRLAQGPATVGELSEPFPMALPNLLKHVRILEQSGLIETQKQGRIRVCAIRPDALSPTEQWLSEQRKQMSGTLDRMEAYAAQMLANKARQTGTEHEDS